MEKGGGSVLVSYCQNDAKFNSPLPLIALYISGATALCLAAMAKDTIDGLRHRRLWFPCKFFSLNATTLTALSIAAKLPLDLSSAMPARHEQLSKLSGTVFVCVSMSFCMPSVGLMDGPDLPANMAALFIFVLTVAGNVVTQIITGVIYSFRAEHVLVLLFMLLLLALMCSAALASHAIKRSLDQEYDSRVPTSLQSADIGLLKQSVCKVWLMAHTASPQYVHARSVLSVAAGVLAVASVLLLMEALVRSFFMEFCRGYSDYRWATWGVLVSQSVAAVVGGIAPAIRWFNAICFGKTSGADGQDLCRAYFGVEPFWVRRLELWKDSALPFHIKNQMLRRKAYRLRDGILDLCIVVQMVLVRFSKAVRIGSMAMVVFGNRLLSFARTLAAGRPSDSSSCMREAMYGEAEVQHCNYVLKVQGEDDLVLYMSSRTQKDMDHWIEKGKGESCGALLSLLSRSSPKQGFPRVRGFDDPSVPAIPTQDTMVPPHCWTLPAVTLMVIATALCNFFGSGVKMMTAAMNEGLELMRFVEKNLDQRGLVNSAKAARLVWCGMDLRDQWMGHSLKGFLVHDDVSLSSAIDAVHRLSELGKNLVMDVQDSLVSLDPRDWPPNALAGNCLYRMGRTIIDCNSFSSVKELLDWIEITLADIVGACLTNLPYAILMEYAAGTAAQREENVRRAAFVLGKCLNLCDSLVWSSFRKPDWSTADMDSWRRGEVYPYEHVRIADDEFSSLE